MKDDGFWDFYWEVRLRDMENLGKRAAILAISRLIREIGGETPLCLLEPGCGEGQIIGALVEAHPQAVSARESLGIDYFHTSVLRCRKDYPQMSFREGDFTDAALLESLGQYDIVLFVNALHEVFSLTRSPETGEVDVPRAKQRVQQALELAARRVKPGGYLVVFDGLEPPGDPQTRLRIRFLHSQAYEHFQTFANEYQPFKVAYKVIPHSDSIELSLRDFTRFIDKSIFLGKRLWQHERHESYQYFTEDEFRAGFSQAGLEIRELRTLTENYTKWADLVEIESGAADFPIEHILIVSQKCGG